MLFTRLVGEVTDLLILILLYSERDNTTIYFRFDVNQWSKEYKVYNINPLKELMLIQAVINLQ